MRQETLSRWTVTRYGRSDEEWAALEQAGWEFLVDQARLEHPTSYSEMNEFLAQQTGVRKFNFDLDSERRAMGELLGRLSDRSVAEADIMISALVHYLDRNDAGPGFYRLAQRMGLLRDPASADQKESFWISQMNSCFAHSW